MPKFDKKLEQKSFEDPQNHKAIFNGAQNLSNQFQVNFTKVGLMSIKVGGLQYCSHGKIYQNRQKISSQPYIIGTNVKFSIQADQIILTMNQKKIFVSKSKTQKIRVIIGLIGPYKFEILKYS